MSDQFQSPCSGLKRATETRHCNYPDIHTLLSVANHPMSASHGGVPLSAMIDFRFTVKCAQDDISFPGISMTEAIAAIETSPDVVRHTWNAPEILTTLPDGRLSVRRPQILADLTSGPRILIEILPEDAIDETVIEVSGAIARTLPHFGLKYMMVFPCQFGKLTAGGPL